MQGKGEEEKMYMGCEQRQLYIDDRKMELQGKESWKVELRLATSSKQELGCRRQLEAQMAIWGRGRKKLPHSCHRQWKGRGEHGKGLEAKIRLKGPPFALLHLPQLSRGQTRP